jgi:polyisoprenoid-binding protein YceI
MKNLISLASLTFAVLALAPGARASEWTFDTAHTEIGFNVKHMMVTDVHGSFEKYDGKIVLDEKDPAKSSVDVSIEITSINTKVEKRDNHLRGSDFFDAATHPKATFKSTKVEKGNKPNTFKVTGDLTLRGVTKPVVLDVVATDAVTDPKEWGGNSHRGVKATTTINRQDFGVKWQTKLDKGGVVAGDEVQIVINAELLEKKADAPKKS